MRKLSTSIKSIGMAMLVSWGLYPIQSVMAAESDPAGVSKTPAPGVWCTDFAAVKKYSEENDIPIVAFWGTTSCAFCDSMLKYGLKSEGFMKYQKERGFMLAYYHGGNKESDYKTWIKNSSGEWPYMAIYWKKGGVNVRFSGRTGKMIMANGRASAGSTASDVLAWTTKWIELAKPGRIGDSKRENDEQLIAAIESYLHSWSAKPAYSGGYFAVTNLPNSRLEAELGVTTNVNVEIFRTATEAVASNKLKINGASKTISWAANQLSQTYSVPLSDMELKAGNSVVLQLIADDNTVMSTSAINIVEPKANSVKNPYWLGEKSADSLGFGEWTMDYDVAKAKAKKEGGHTLVLVSGVLWCPFCKTLEEKILNDEKFGKWAKENKVSLVVLDNPKRSADDKKDKNGNLISVGVKANGNPPTLLRFAEAKGVSGAEYLSRKMIAAIDAEAVLQRNHDLCYQDGDLAAPESLRTGYPTFIMLDSNGNVVGRLLDGCNNATYSWGLSLDETLARLDELLLLSGTENDSKPSTTTLSLAVEEEVFGELQVNDNVKFYRLTNVPAGKVMFNATASKAVRLRVYERGSDMTLAKAKLLGEGENAVEVIFAGSTKKLISVSAFEDNLAEYGRNTAFEYTISSCVTLVPQLAKGEFTPISSQVGLSVEKGVTYKLDGFSADSLAKYFTGGSDGLYVAKETVTAAFDVAKPKISYQIWNPGTVSFTKASQRILESEGKGTITLIRTGGSGKAVVDVTAVSKPERVTFSGNMRFVWEDGETGDKTISFTIAADKVFQPDEDLVLTLTAAGDVAENAAVVGSVVKHTLTVTDTDDPVLEKSAYSIRLYEDFDAREVFPVYNIKENDSVSVEKIDGKLPSGVKLKYDEAAKSLVLSGRATKTGSFQYRFAVSEERAAGEVMGMETVFNIEVVNAAELPSSNANYNPYVGRALETDLPVYAELEGSALLAGVLSVSVSKSNRITAKFDGARSKSLSIKGYWQDMVDGIAVALLEKDNVTIGIELSRAGVLKVSEIKGLDTDFKAPLFSIKDGVKVVGQESKYGKYAGYYTVTLPLNADALSAAAETVATGTGYLTLKMNKSSFTKKGTVSYAGILADGTSVSGSAMLLCDLYRENEVDQALLPVFKQKSKGTLGAMLSVAAGAKDSYAVNPMVVLAESGTAAFWVKNGEIFKLDVYGGFYDSDMDLIGCCDEVYKTQKFKAAFDTQWFAASEQYGKISKLPVADLLVEGSGFAVENKNDLKYTLKLKKSTGIVSGKVPVLFADGTKKSLTYKGVLLPRWHDCGCSDMPVLERPFASGAAYYSDKVDGDSEKRGFAVDVVPVN